ncbi:MAG: FAD:protein FMN transferase, partial [Ruminiclostridium sp.]|nr:FAD:protein FMN transferase [Ruminiclostridium sp.]
MKSKSKAKCLAAALMAAIVLTGCNSYNEADINTSEFFAMDTYISISAYGEQAENALDNCRKEIKSLDSQFSVTDPDSEISRINGSKGQGVSLSNDADKIITAALELGKKTKGALDISLYPVVREWGFTLGEYKI